MGKSPAKPYAVRLYRSDRRSHECRLAVSSSAPSLERVSAGKAKLRIRLLWQVRMSPAVDVSVERQRPC